jgi:predicted transcriptional regulator
MDENIESAKPHALEPVRHEYPPRIYSCKVRELREAKQITLHTLAAELGVTPLTMTRVEEGCDLKLSNALRLCEILETTIIDCWAVKQA